RPDTGGERRGRGLRADGSRHGPRGRGHREARGSGTRCRGRCLLTAGSAGVDEAVARVALWSGLTPKVSPLSGGLTNENYLVEAGGQRYVLRLPGQSTELLSIDRANEVFNITAAATTGIGPRVLEHVPGLDVTVLEFIAGPTMSAATLQSKQMAARTADSFRRLHSSPRFLQDFNRLRPIEDYLRIIDGPQAATPSRHRERL